MRKMRKMKFYPSIHTEMVLHVSKQMEKDIEDCYVKAFDKGKNCDNCSWKDVTPYGIDICGNKEVVNKIIGEKCIVSESKKRKL